MAVSCCSSAIDFDSIPLTALNGTVRKKLALYLNPKQVSAADWTALAEAMGFEYLEIKNYEQYPNPTKMILENWEPTSTQATVGKLLEMLTAVERVDVISDLQGPIGLAVRLLLHSTAMKRRVSSLPDRSFQ
ncbi:UNVERIFIED_CONTAM: hypothetical protein FKN15_011404 [Acipenser sinensis]